MVSVEYDGRTTDDITFDEFVQVAVRPVEDGEVDIRRKVVEQVEQCQTRNAYPVFEHIDMLLLVEGELFVDGSEEGYDVTFVVPDETLAQRGHYVVMPDGLAASLVFVGYAFIF